MKRILFLLAVLSFLFGALSFSALAGQYENVVMVLSGHYSWDNIMVLQQEGAHGNTVTQMLIDPQMVDYLLSGVGLVAMFYFSEDGSVIDVEYYSPEWDRYYKNVNQLRIELKTERFEGAFPWMTVLAAALVLMLAAGAAVLLLKKRKG